MKTRRSGRLRTAASEHVVGEYIDMHSDSSPKTKALVAVAGVILTAAVVLSFGNSDEAPASVTATVPTDTQVSVTASSFVPDIVSTTVPVTTIPVATTVPVTTIPVATTPPVVTIPPTTVAPTTIPPTTIPPTTVAPASDSVRMLSIETGELVNITVVGWSEQATSSTTAELHIITPTGAELVYVYTGSTAIAPVPAQGTPAETANHYFAGSYVQFFDNQNTWKVALEGASS